MFNKKRKAMVIKMKKRFFSAFMSALMLLSSFAFVYADETTAGTSAVNSVWEPSYNASDWTTTENSTFAFNSSAKSVSYTGNDKQTAKYKNTVLDGDFIMTADLKVDYMRSSITLGELELVFLTEKTTLYNGAAAGDVILASGGNEITRATGKGVTDWKNAKITVIYKNSGEIMLYRNDDSENKLIMDYKASDIAGKNDRTLAITSYYAAGSVGNIKMYKRFGSSFGDDFNSENPLTDNWEFNTENGYIRMLKDKKNETDPDDYAIISNENNGGNTAELKPIFTTGGYSISLDLNTYNDNRHYIYFNKTSDKALYSLCLRKENGKRYIYILKGETESGNTNVISDKVEIESGVYKVRIDYTPPQGSAEGKINVCLENSKTTLKLAAEDSSFVMGKVGVKCAWITKNVTFDNFEIVSLSDVLEVNQPEITGEFANGKTVTGSVKVFNSTKNSIDASVILGIYDNGRLVDIKISKNTIDALCGEKVISASYTFDGYDAGKMYSAKCFVLDSMESLKPLAPPAVKYDTHKLILIGDSTCTEYKTDSTNINNQRGWGMYMQKKFDSNYVEVINRAYGGYTAKSFIDGDGWAGDKGNWTLIKELISPGDTVLINLGINDQVKIDDASVTDYTSWEQFEGYIDTMVKDVKAKGGEAAVISSSVGVGESFKWGTGESHMQNVADSNSIDCLKLNTMMKDNFTKELGEELTKDNAYKLLQKYYCRVIKDGALTDGYDGTHFGETGARYATDCIATMLKDTGMSIAGKIK